MRAAFFMELMVGIEPTTCSLRVNCSAIEPHQRIQTLMFIILKKQNKVNIIFVILRQWYVGLQLMCYSSE